MNFPSDFLPLTRLILYILSVICFLIDVGYSASGTGFPSDNNKTILAFALFCIIKVMPLIGIILYSFSRVYNRRQNQNELQGLSVKNRFSTRLLWRKLNEHLYIGSMGNRFKDVIYIERLSYSIFKYKVSFAFDKNFVCELVQTHTLEEAKSKAQAMIIAHYQEISNPSYWEEETIMNEFIGDF